MQFLVPHLKEEVGQTESVRKQKNSRKKKKKKEKSELIRELIRETWNNEHKEVSRALETWLNVHKLHKRLAKERLNNQFSIFIMHGIKKVSSGKKHSEKLPNAGNESVLQWLPREVCGAFTTGARNELCQQR